MFQNLTEIETFLKDQQIRMVDLKWCDLWGRWRHVTISSRVFDAGLMHSGIGFDGSSVGFRSVTGSDMALIPDLKTGFLDPFCETPTLSFICNIVEPDSKKPYILDPRQIAQRAQDYLRSSGIADCSLWGPEFEFYIFKDVTFYNNPYTSSYHVECSESDWDNDLKDNSYLVQKRGGYHCSPPNDQFFDMRTKMSIDLEDAGVPVKYHHHEAGGPGQCEIETSMLEMVRAADASMLIKYYTKQIAKRAGHAVTFLPKPLFDMAGNGMHFHQHLYKGDTNLFYDPSQTDLISQTARYYIGGLLTHAPALLAFTNPSTNSYRRLVPGFEAPVNCFYGGGNRSAAIRIPKYATTPDAVRIEFRPPDATCNPYLAMPAMLLAGLDGIRRKIDPTENGFGPFEVDPFTLPDDERSRIKSLPGNLKATMKALEEDHTFLLEGAVFNDELIQLWIESKVREQDDLDLRPHPREIEKYFDI